MFAGLCDSLSRIVCHRCLETVNNMADIEDLKDNRVPSCLYWSVDQVADWIESLGFPQYKICFTSNLINGRRLTLIEASAFPNIGITDFQHIKFISKSIRDVLMLEDPYWNRSITLPPKSDLGLYLEQKTYTGKHADGLTFGTFLRHAPNIKWRPPLANQCLILPHD